MTNALETFCNTKFADLKKYFDTCIAKMDINIRDDMQEALDWNPKSTPMYCFLALYCQLHKHKYGNEFFVESLT